MKISRSRSFQRVRDSFRQLRRHKSESDHKLDQKSAETEAEQPEVKSEEEEKVVETAVEQVEKLTIEETEKKESELTEEKVESAEVEKIESAEVEKVELKDVEKIESAEVITAVEQAQPEDVKDAKDEPEITAVYVLIDLSRN